MKRFFNAIWRFFLPPADGKLFLRILPLVVVAFLVVVFFVLSNAAWEGSNSPSFCGTTCHTMPPQYVSYQRSPHSNVTCEDCHMGRDILGVMLQRKIAYSWQTGSAMLLNTYKYPIVAKNMAPAREACENCHNPEKFSSDKLIEIKHYAEDAANTEASTFLIVKTGGGTQRQGLGYGIHWHIENPVYFYSTDPEQQTIPYIVVTNPDGTKKEYIDSESKIDPKSIQPGQMHEMDCITCHNRTSHLFLSPQEIMDDLLTRGQVSATLPGIKQKGVEVLSASYASPDQALAAISALEKYYQDVNVYKGDSGVIGQAVKSIQQAYSDNNFSDQQVNWQTHPNNLGHINSPGCFRCHDGKHQTSSGTSIRLECNLCHSIPVSSSPDQITASIEVSKGSEPDSHQNTNWISIHREVVNDSCQGCHTVDDAGGVSNTSFCSNSLCHGATWKFAGFDAPSLRSLILEQAKKMITPTPVPSPTLIPTATVESTVVLTSPTPTPTSAARVPPVDYQTIAAIFKSKCGGCHGENGNKGLNLLTYTGVMKGSKSGPVIVPGDPSNSLIVQVQSGAKKHFGQLSADELNMLIAWIQAGAAEK